MTSEIREQIKDCVKFADGERYSWDEIQQRPDLKVCVFDSDKGIVDPDSVKERDPHRQRQTCDERHRVYIPGGVCCTYVIEEQPIPLGWSRHLSISIMESDSYVPMVLAIALAKLFGFTDPPSKWIRYEDQGAVNLLQSLGEGGGREIPEPVVGEK